MRQLALDIRPSAPPSFDSFVPGENGELLARLRVLAKPETFDAIYVWGDTGSGRSHMLQATRSAAEQAGRPLVFRNGAEVSDDLPLPPGGLLLVDDVQAASAEGQIALFRAYNTARLIGLAMLICGDAPPLQLALREDLRTRIGQSLIYQVQPLNDDEKAEFLARHAKSRGLSLEPELIAYLLRHGRRDLHSLMAVLDAVDETTLVHKRPVTLPLLREILQAMNQ